MSRSINLMSERACARDCWLNCARQWTRILAIVVGVLTLHTAFNWWPVHKQSQQRIAMDSQYEPVRRLKTTNQDLKKRIDESKQLGQLELTLEKRTPTTTLAGLVSQAVAKCHGNVFLENIDYQQQGSDGSATRDSSAKLSLEGIATDPKAVRVFAELLKSSIPNASTEAEQFETIEINQQQMQAFRIDCFF